MSKNVTVVELGGLPRISNEAKTVAELTKQMNIPEGLEVSINGKSASYDTVLNEYDYVSFGKKVKGGNQ